MCGTLVRCAASTGMKPLRVDAHAGVLRADLAAVRRGGPRPPARGRRASGAGAVSPAKCTRRPSACASIRVDARRQVDARVARLDARGAAAAPGRGRRPSSARAAARRRVTCGAERVVHGGELEPDDAAADDQQARAARRRPRAREVESRMRGSSGRPGSARAREPAAMMACSKPMRRARRPRVVDAQLRSRRAKRPAPGHHLHAALLRQLREPAGEAAHHAVLEAAQLRRSRASARRTRRRAARGRARPRSPAATCSSAFDGMQPTFRQTPPSVG